MGLVFRQTEAHRELHGALFYREKRAENRERSNFPVTILLILFLSTADKLIDDLEQGGFVRALNGAVRFSQYFGELREVAVFLKRLTPVLSAGAERIVGQHHNRKLLCDRRGIEVLPVQKLLLGVDLHAPAKIYVDFLTVGVGRIFQGFSLPTSPDALCFFGYSYIMYRVEYYPCGGAV